MPNVNIITFVESYLLQRKSGKKQLPNSVCFVNRHASLPVSWFNFEFKFGLKALNQNSK